VKMSLSEAYLIWDRISFSQKLELLSLARRACPEKVGYRTIDAEWRPSLDEEPNP
jgi:hypothetical protein